MILTTDFDFTTNISRKLDQRAAKQTNIFNTRHWRSITDVSLTLKQARQSDDGIWVRIDEIQCRRAFRHFLNLLNRAVYGNAVRRHGKRVRAIPVIEKELDGRWHFHAAIEPPIHIGDDNFQALIGKCWDRVDWGYREIVARPNANEGWIDYMLKPRQKSGLEAWSDCIDWNCFHNPIADA